MRFHSLEHLDWWANTRFYPEIHNDLFLFLIQESEGKRFVDLGACYGLLAERINSSAFGWKAFAVEANEQYIQTAKQRGITVDFLHLKITRETIPQLCDYIRANNIDAVVARRVMPEFWGDDIEGGKLFAEQIRAAGVKEVVLEGRAKTRKAVNALASIDDEIALFAGHYKIAARSGAIARLV